MKPQILTIENYREVLQGFHEESDRGAAVLAGSFAEHYLGNYLMFFFPEDVDTDAMFGNSGALSSFSQRIEIAYAFGLLTKSSRRDLSLVRKIRNHFAHHPADSGFEASPVREWVEGLSIPATIRSTDGSVYVEHNRKSRYILSISMCIAELHNAMLVRKSGGGA